LWERNPKLGIGGLIFLNKCLALCTGHSQYKKSESGPDSRNVMLGLESYPLVSANPAVSWWWTPCLETEPKLTNLLLTNYIYY
jgi:hypothetical protein